MAIPMVTSNKEGHIGGKLAELKCVIEISQFRTFYVYIEQGGDGLHGLVKITYAINVLVIYEM
jgi:hypothetical protein